MSMTRKQYEAIAQAVAEARPTPEVAAVAQTLADIFEADNPYFNRSWFLAAAQVEDECEHGNVPDECQPCFFDAYPTQTDYDNRNDPRI